MKNIIGHPARGANFYPRPEEVRKIRRSLSAGNHIQIAAPRRVGKTSILLFFIDNAEQNFDFVYVDVEACINENDFYRKIYEAILKSDALTKGERFIKQLKASGNIFLKRIRSINVAEGGIELKDHAEISYYDELCNLIRGLDFGSRTLVVLIDEFPYAINNLIVGIESQPARDLLKSKRTIRQDPILNKKIQFVYTGSISLNATVERIGSSELVNDLDSISIDPLTEKDGKQLLKNLVENDGIVLSEELLQYIVKKMGWIIPFHIQLFVKELDEIVYKNEAPVTLREIDEAFNKIIDLRNNNYFEHYASRLKKLFKEFDYDLVVDILTHVAEHDEISLKDIYNYAAKYNLEAESSKIVRALEYDGYIFSDSTGKTYRFNSFILKMWWKKYVSK